MTEINIPLPSEVSSEQSVAPTDKAQPTSAESVTPPTEKPAGDEKSHETEPADAQSRRKQRNRERWQNMREERVKALERADRAEAELRAIKEAAKRDYSQYTDPTEELAVRTADKLREMQSGNYEHAAKSARSVADAAMVQAWSSVVEDARAWAPDFDTVFNDSVPVHARAAPLMVESEKGGEIAYYLGKNPEEAAQLYRLFESNPAQGLIQFGRLEARVSKADPKSVSTAPKPAATLAGGPSPLGFDPTSASVTDMAAVLRKAGLIR